MAKKVKTTAEHQSKGPKQPQDLFKNFVENCIVNDNTLLTKPTDGELFTKENLEKTKDFLVWVIAANQKNAKNKNNNAEEAKDKYGVSNIFNVNDSLWKETNNDNHNQEVVIKILLHCYWLMYLGSDRLNMQTGCKDYYVENAQVDYFSNIKCVWAIGQTFTRDPLGVMLKIVKMIIELKDSKEKGIIEYWSNNDDNEKNYNIANILLYFSDPKHFLPIPSYQNKKKISDNLGCLIDKDEKNEIKFPEGMSDLDKNLYKIREVLKKDGIVNNCYQYSPKVTLDDNPFWHPDIKPFWEDTTSNLKGDLSLEDLLEYKKALVLYGPPGTSKSYSAREIAKHIIVRALRNSKKKLTTNIIKGFDGTYNAHIHSLQFHPNYTYDDFIIGKTIKNNSVEVKYGWLLELIYKIQQNKKDSLPHIIILDEINRVDISRVFGELLTAMEPAYRGNGVELSIKDNNGTDTIDLKVPENMYFIGTMNQIDFSLEQVDFALRRRFIWQLSTYNKDTLKHIIETKIDEDITSDTIDVYCSQCTQLNNVIKNNENLGESYWIGHTYFAEIVDIYNQIKAKNNADWNTAKNVLWQISIRPTLEAYCGTMDPSKQKEFIDKCQKAFVLTENSDESDSNEQ